MKKRAYITVLNDIMEGKEASANRRGETSLRLSEKANQDLTKLVKDWKASSKKEALEAMINYFKRLGISPLEEVPDTVGKRLEKRVDQIIAFIRQNEKIHREDIEKVLLFARQQQGGNHTATAQNPATGIEDEQLQEQLEKVKKGLLILNENDKVLQEVQTTINHNLEEQNKLLTARLVSLKDPTAIYHALEKNLNIYKDSVLSNPGEVEQYTQRALLFFKKLLQLTAP